MLFGRLAGLAIAGRLDGDFALPGADFADRLMVVEAGAPGIDAQFAYFSQLLASGGLQGRFAAGRLLRGRFVHAWKLQAVQLGENAEYGVAAF